MAKDKSNAVAESFLLPADVLEKERSLHQNLTSKSEKVPFSLLFANFGRNIRIRQGSEVYGVKFMADTYDTDSLMTAIIELGYIRDPLTVSKKLIDGKTRYEVLRGFRRYDAAQRIIQAGTNQNVIKALQEIPCNVYENLTPEQEDALINDQTSKQFMACEVLKEVWRRLGNGESWQVIGLHMSEQIERATGAHGKTAEIRKAQTQSEKLSIVQDWLNNTLNMFWQGVFLYGGPKCRKWLFLTYADKDGLLTDKDEKSPIKFTSSVWNGKEGLYAAIREDLNAGQWVQKEGTGPKFEERVKEIQAKQSAPRGKKNPNEPTAKSGAVIQGMANVDGRAEPIRQAIMSCLENSPTFQLDQWDSKLNSWARKTEAFNASRGHLPPAVVELLSLAFDSSASPDDFDAKIASLIVAPTATKPPATEPEGTDASETGAKGKHKPKAGKK